MQKLLAFFFSKNISIYAIFNDTIFNDMLTNDIVSFKQLGPGFKWRLTVEKRLPVLRQFTFGMNYLKIWFRSSRCYEASAVLQIKLLLINRLIKPSILFSLSLMCTLLFLRIHLYECVWLNVKQFKPWLDATSCYVWSGSTVLSQTWLSEYLR